MPAQAGSQKVPLAVRAQPGFPPRVGARGDVLARQGPGCAGVSPAWRTGFPPRVGADLFGTDT